MKISKKRFAVLVSILIVFTIVLVGLMIIQNINKMKVKEILIKKCDEYVEFTENKFPIEFIGYSKAKREEYAKTYLNNKKNVYELLFSKNVPEHLKELEICTKIVNDAVDLKSLSTYADYSISKLSILKATIRMQI